MSEMFTEQEKDIFLTAMYREIRECREYDDEMEDVEGFKPLVPVCESIIEKVKKAFPGGWS